MLNYQRVEDVISGKLSEIKYQLIEQVLFWMMLNYRHIDIDYGIANVFNYPDTYLDKTPLRIIPQYCNNPQYQIPKYNIDNHIVDTTDIPILLLQILI